MNRLYSKQTGCTYLEGFSPSIPDDAVPISEEVYLAVIANPDPEKMRSHDEDGLPILVDFPVVPKTTDDYVKLIAATRYEYETAGITLDGMPIDTGRDSQALITGARVESMDDPSYVCNWKTSVGFVSLSADLLKAIGTAVRTHVQKCFDREGELLDALAAGTFTESMLSEGWPDDGAGTGEQ